MASLRPAARARNRSGPAVRRPAAVLTSLSALTAVLTASILVGPATLSASATPSRTGDLEHKRDSVKHKIKKADSDLDETSARLQSATAALLQARSDLANAQADLARTESELATARALDRKMQAKLDAAEARLAAARKALTSSQVDVEAQERQLSQLAVSGYEGGDPDLLGLSMVFTTQDPAQLAGSLDASSSVANSESALLDHLQASRVILSVKEDELQAAEEEVAVQRKAAAANLRLKQALQVQARLAAQRVLELVRNRTEAREAAARAKKSDLSELKQLQAERDRIEQLIIQQASVGTATGMVHGNGFLDMPVQGPITSPFGWRIHPIYGYRSLHDGVDLGAACGTPIRAAAAGTVLSEYYQTAWGNRIIIDHGVHHGVGLATISNHMSGYAVAVGEHVERGQVVGYVGTTGWSTGCHLHFTVLQNGTAVDPMSWF